MAQMILETIVKYWLQILLALISGGLGFLCKNYRKLYLAEKKHKKSEEEQAFYDGLKKIVKESSAVSRKAEQVLQDEINELKQQTEIIKEGILSMQGRSFKKECKEFLQPNRQFTVDEFEALQDEYEVYKKLGGNHDGDKLFNLVDKKASNILTDDK